MLSITQKGDFKKTLTFFKKNKVVSFSNLDAIAKRGITRLSNVTPIDTGTTANSWYYKIVNSNHKITITYYNENIQNGVNIAILLQYGHATKSGGWVQGVDYINPALKPIFADIENEVWKEVTKS